MQGTVGFSVEFQRRLETHIGRDLSDDEILEIGDYLDGQDWQSDIIYIVELFDLFSERYSD